MLVSTYPGRMVLLDSHSRPVKELLLCVHELDTELPEQFRRNKTKGDSGLVEVRRSAMPLSQQVVQMVSLSSCACRHFEGGSGWRDADKPGLGLEPENDRELIEELASLLDERDNVRVEASDDLGAERAEVVDVDLEDVGASGGAEAEEGELRVECHVV